MESEGDSPSSAPAPHDIAQLVDRSRDPNRRRAGNSMGADQAARTLTLPRTKRPNGEALQAFRENFTHWLHDETQDPYAQRAFRTLLRNKDMKMRLEAWKLAAAVLAPGSAPFERPKGDNKVAIQFVNKVARPEKVIATEAK